MLGQLIMPRLEITNYEADALYRSAIHNLIVQKMAGGFCVFGGTVESLPVILDELQVIAKKTGIPELFMSCDCEWGLPMRLHSGGTEFPHLMALERMGDQEGIRRVANAIAIEMSALGLHWNFAPVADINSNPDNPIINIRSFSGKASVVAECAESFFKGLDNAGIIATAKHFPGHGDTHIDSHRELPSIDKSAEAFDALELLPFKHLSEKGIPSIMTGHIAAPKLALSLGANEEEKDLPATISQYLTSILLRERICFEGVIITDSLEMYGLQKVVSDPKEIAIRAFSAGADILLMPSDPITAYYGLNEALHQNRISLRSVKESIARIDKLRNKYVIEKPAKIVVQWLDHQEISRSAARNSFDLTGAITKPLLPSSVLIIASGGNSEKRQRDDLNSFFLSEFSGIHVYLLNGEASGKDIVLGSKPLIITLSRPRGALTEDVNDVSVSRIVREIAHTMIRDKIHPAGVISFGDPYIAEEFARTGPNFILRTFSDSNPSLHVTFQFLKEYI